MEFKNATDRGSQCCAVSPIANSKNPKSRGQCHSLLTPFSFARFSPYIWRRRAYEPEILVNYLADKFLYNGEIVTALGKSATEEDVGKIATALRDCDCLLMGYDDLDLEYLVSMRYFSDQSQLAAEHEELRTLAELKSDFVARQDFENAGRKRKQQDAIRDRIDSEARVQFLRTQKAKTRRTTD